jgi:hypothetical protein
MKRAKCNNENDFDIERLVEKNKLLKKQIERNRFYFENFFHL